MLRDLLEFARSPYPWYLAPMGYVREQRGIADRARSLSGAWSTHLDRTRSTIEASVEACQSRRSVLVVGSGRLLDVPLETLCNRFESVCLVDILHRPGVRKRARAFQNLDLIAADVTGVAHDVFRAARRRDVRSLPASTPPALSLPRFDLVASVNLLSQLPVIPCAYLAAHCPQLVSARLRDFARSLITAHMQWLLRIADRVCLVTDVQRTEVSRTGPVSRTDLIEGVALPCPDETWDWDIAPMGTVYPDRSATHRVHAYRSFRQVEPAPNTWLEGV